MLLSLADRRRCRRCALEQQGPPSRSRSRFKHNTPDNYAGNEASIPMQRIRIARLQPTHSLHLIAGWAKLPPIVFFLFLFFFFFFFFFLSSLFSSFLHATSQSLSAAHLSASYPDKPTTMSGRAGDGRELGRQAVLLLWHCAYTLLLSSEPSQGMQHFMAWGPLHLSPLRAQMESSVAL